MNQQRSMVLLVVFLGPLFDGYASGQTVALVESEALPNPFTLDDAQQRRLDEVLEEWERSSQQVESFACRFKLREYIRALGQDKVPARVADGELAYRKPHEWYFKTTAVRIQVGNGWGGPRPGEDWYCDGESTYAVDHELRQLTERPIPRGHPEQVDLALPGFLWLQSHPLNSGRPPYPIIFGDSPSSLHERFWLSLPEKKWLENRLIWQFSAAPRGDDEAAWCARVDIMLAQSPDTDLLLPLAVRIERPNGEVQSFELRLESAAINSPTLAFTPTPPEGYQQIHIEPPEDAGI